MLVRYSPLFSTDGPPVVVAAPPAAFADAAWSLQEQVVATPPAAFAEEDWTLEEAP